MQINRFPPPIRLENPISYTLSLSVKASMYRGERKKKKKGGGVTENHLAQPRRHLLHLTNSDILGIRPRTFSGI